MTDYQQQALNFLKACNATMTFECLGPMYNENWNDNVKRNRYTVTLTTPKGKMIFDFWDSIRNTEITSMTLDEYFCKTYKMHFKDGFISEQNKATKELSALKAKAKPTEYDILACLEKYDPGTMNDFFDEFGFKINSADDMFAFMNTYNACVKQYRDLCRIFTEEQMEMLRGIN